MTEEFPNIQFNNLDVEAELCRKDYHYFVKSFWGEIEGDEFIDNWHIKYLCNEIQKVVERVINRQPKLYDLCINIPPGFTKSTLTSKMLLPWIWTKNQGVRYLVTSYGSDLSEKFMIKDKQIIKSDKYKDYFGSVKFNPKLDRNKHFRNMHHGEGVCTSVGGTVMGQHYDIHVWDDLLKVKQARSESARLDMKEHITETLSGRKTNRMTTPTISVSQRLHMSDQTGIMMDYFTHVKHIVIPMDNQDYKPHPEELSQYYEDNLIQPKRFGWEQVKSEKKKGTIHYATQYGLSPSAKSGSIWRDNFTWEDIDQMPARYKLADYGTDWDTAYTKKTINSATAYITSGRFGENIFIYDAGFFWKETPEAKEFIRDMENAGRHFFENKANGKSIHDDLKREGENVKLVTDIPNKGDSIARANRASDYTQNVYINNALKHKILNSRKQGILDFPNNDNDDLSDALSQAILRHKQMKSALW